MSEASPGGRMPISYILPLRWADESAIDELSAYLEWLDRSVELIVVDGSAPDRYEAHRRRWRGLGVHVRPDADLPFANGKVNGVITGIRRATNEAAVIADDDVRYLEAELQRMAILLQTADLVRPQNYFSPRPWHARWDTARTLLNRAFGADHPGTLGVGRKRFLAMGGYDGDCLFENLELVRTVRASGGVVLDAPDLYVCRLPPTAGGFLRQRVRQAYDDLAQPGRLAFALAIVPTGMWLAAVRPRGLVVAGLASMAVAEYGRRRHGGRERFSPLAPLFAPLWVAERGVCSWLALGMRLLLGGMPYAGTRLRTASHSESELRARLRRRQGTEPGPGSARLVDVDEPTPDARNPVTL
jgi:Glycosyl transferase family 2